MTEREEILARALDRERTARREAERLLETKSRELWAAREAERAARVSAEREADRLRSIAGATPDLLMAVDEVGHITFYAGGSSPTEEELRSHLCAPLRAAIARVVQYGQPDVVEYTLPSGRTYEARLTRVDGGEAMVLSRDVTAERSARSGLAAEADEAREARRAVEHTLTETLAAVNAGSWHQDVPSGRMEWSEGVYRLLGFAPGSVEPHTELWQARIHPVDLQRIQAALPRRTTTIDYRILLPDGTVRWCRGWSSTTFDEHGEPSQRRGLLIDITQERQRANDLSRLAEVASRTGNGVVLSDLQGRIEWVNEAFTRLTGWTLEEVRGKRPGAFLQGPHTDRAVAARMAACIRALAPFEGQILNYTKGWRQYWVNVETRVCRDEDGVPTGFVGIQTDVTEQRIAAATANLAQSVAAILLESDSVESAGKRVVAQLVSLLDVRAAQIWTVEHGKPELQYLAGASSMAAGPAGEAFLDATRKLTFRAGLERYVGVGVPGKAWGTGRPALLDDLTRGIDLSYSRRVHAGVDAGVRTLCATPILGPNGVLGVIEIGGTHFYPGHERLPTILARVAEQVASFLLRDASRRAFRDMFEHSPDALLAVREDGTISNANVRAHALFADPQGAAIGALIQDGAELVATVLAPTYTPESGGGARLYHRGASGRFGPFSAEVSVSLSGPGIDRGAILAVRDLTERHRMEAALTESLREKDTLLREVHHRVKNNLQIVSSLLTLQSEHVAEPTAQDALAEAVQRVRSMSGVHQQLYGTETLSDINFGEYATTLGASLQASMDPTATFTYDVAPVDLTIDTAVPCGLILNELVTNALKHGRPASGRSAVAIRVQPTENGFALSVTDNGPGMRQASPRSSALGAQLIRSLVRQLRATQTVEESPGGGTVVTIHVPRPPPRGT